MEQRAIGRLAGDGGRAPADGDGRHQDSTAAGVGGGVGRAVAGPGRRAAGVGGVAAGPCAEARARGRRRSRRATASASPSSNGARITPSSVTMPVIRSAGVTSNAGLRTSVSGGAMRHAADEQDLGGLALLDRDRLAVRRGEVDRADRRGDEERDAVARGEHGQRVRPDLVRGVAVGGDPVGADDDDVDLAARHQVAGGDIGDQRVRHLRLRQLPGRQPRALEIGPGLVDPDVDGPAGVVGRLDDAQRGPELAARERSGVAVGQDPERPVLRELERLQPERRPGGRGPRSSRR